MVVNGNQMMQVGGNVTSPMRVVTAGSGSNDGGTVTVMNTQSPGSNSQTNQGIVINGQGQKVVQLVMAQPGTPTTPTRVVGKYSLTQLSYMVGVVQYESYCIITMSYSVLSSISRYIW